MLEARPKTRASSSSLRDAIGMSLLCACAFGSCVNSGSAGHAMGPTLDAATMDASLGDSAPGDAAGEPAPGDAADSGDAAVAAGVCSDPSPWTPPPDPGPCTDAPPWTTTGTPGVQLHVDAGAPGAPWNRFYETAVASDHANTLLCTAWGRNIQNALRKAHAQAGFGYVRFHGILDRDIGVYSEDASGAPVYSWTRLDAVYDAIVAAGMRPVVELSFMPAAMASTGQRLTALWYNGASPTISPPKDWTKWETLMAQIVTHLEGRYGASEVRNNWYFEVWNEPSWMYSLGDNGYVELYTHTQAGLVQGDPQVKVGGPAGSSGESAWLDAQLIVSAQTSGLKLDFISYHRYGNDVAPGLDANGMQTFHQSIVSLLQKNNFTGKIIEDEFGPSSVADLSRDTEASASFIAKTVHLIGTDPTFAPPWSYAYWAVSDLYEEINTGTATAYREGNFGLMLKGDPAIAESFDVAKPAFNAFRLLHRMGATQLPVTGGTTGDGVNAAATLSADGQTVQVLLYNHVLGQPGDAGALADPTQSTLVSLTVDHVPAGAAHVRHFIVDHTHANSHTAWVSMNKPAQPTQSQWVTLRDSAELCYYPQAPTLTTTSWSVMFPQNVYSASLVEIGP
jgi:xylan 1,4-beta-xylosidase